MGEFGWAYIKGALTASGPTGSLQFRDDNDGKSNLGVLTGSARLIFNTASSTLLVTGSVIIDGNLTVSGTTTSISSSNLVIRDPIIGLGFGTASAMTGTAGDRGFIFGLPTDNNQALLWDQSSASFIVGKVGAPGPERTAYDIPEGNYSTLKVGNLRASGSTGQVFAYKILTSGDVNASGNVNVGGNYSGSKGLFTNQLNVAGPLRVTGSFSGSSTGYLGALDVAGNIGTSGSVTVKSVLSGTNAIFGGGGGVNVAGPLRVTGSISGSNRIFGYGIETSGQLGVSGSSVLKSTLSGTNAIFGGGGGVNVAGPFRVTGSFSGSKGIFNHQLDVAGNLGVSGSTTFKGDFSGSKGIFSNQLNVADNLRVSGSFSGSKGIFNHQLNVAGPFRVTGSFSGSSTGYLGALDVAGNIGASGSATVKSFLSGTNAIFAKGVNIANQLRLTGSLSASNRVFGFGLETSGQLGVSGSTTLKSTLSGTNAVFANGAMIADQLIVSGNVGIGTISPDNKLTVAGGHISSEKGLKTGTAHFQWSGRTAAFANGASDLVSYLNFGDHSAWGWIEVTVTDGHNNARCTGKYTKRYQIGRNASTAINHQLSEVPASIGAVADEFKLGDFEVDSNDLRIPIYRVTTSGNYLTVFVEGELTLAADNVDGILGDLALSSPAEVSNSETRDYYSIMATRVGIGTVTPTHTLAVAGDFSGSKGIFNHQLNVADNLRVSGSFSGSKGIFNHQLDVAGPLSVTGTLSGTSDVIFARNVFVAGSTFITGSTAITGNLFVSGNATFGDATGDSVTINAATVNVKNIATGSDPTSQVKTLMIDTAGKLVFGVGGSGGGGSTNPGGATTEVQFNDGGAFAGSSLMEFNKTTGQLSLTGTLSGSSAIFNSHVNIANQLRLTGSLSASNRIFGFGVATSGDIGVSGSAYVGSALSGTNAIFAKSVNIADQLRLTGSLSASNRVFGFGFETSGDLGVSGSTMLKSSLSGTNAIFANGVNIADQLRLTGSLSASNRIFGYGLETSGQLGVSGSAYFGSALTASAVLSGTNAIFAKGVDIAGNLNVSGAAVFNETGVDQDFRIESVDETHMIFVEGSSNRVSIGDSVDSPAATLEITNNASAGAYNVPLVQLNNNDVDQFVLDITAANTTVKAIEVKASNTTSNVMEITGSALTTGGLLHLQSNSSDAGNRTLFTVHNDHESAIGVQMVHFKNDALGGTGDPILLVESTAEETEAIVEIRNTNVATNKPPILKLNRASWADADDMGIGTIIFQGVNDPVSPSKIEYATIVGTASDTAEEDEGGKIVFNVFAGGQAGTAASTNLLSIGGEVKDGAVCEVVVNDAGIDCNFRVESDDETHMLFVDAENNRVSIGDDTDGTTATFEVTNANHANFNTTLVQLNNNEADQIALDINAVNTTAHTVDITAANTTTNVINITANDCLSSGAGIAIDHNDGATTAVGPVGIKYDFDKDGVQGDDITSGYTGIQVNMTDAATNDEESNVTMIGMDLDVDSASNQGTNTNVGLDIKCTNATSNYGIVITTDDDSASSADIVMKSDGDNNDYAAISAGSNGALTITTADQAAAAADLVLNIDGDFVVDTTAAEKIQLSTNVSTEPGGGFDISGAVTSYTAEVNGIIETTYLLDIVGLRSFAADNAAKRVIGEDGVAAAHFGRIDVAKNGIIYRAELGCIEGPAGESDIIQDIDVVASTAVRAQGAIYDSDGTNVAIITAGANWLLGMFGASTFDPFGGTGFTSGLDDYYLYLVSGAAAGNDIDFNAGKFVLKLYGAKSF